MDCENIVCNPLNVRKIKRRDNKKLVRNIRQNNQKLKKNKKNKDVVDLRQSITKLKNNTYIESRKVGYKFKLYSRNDLIYGAWIGNKFNPMEYIGWNNIDVNFYRDNYDYNYDDDDLFGRSNDDDDDDDDDYDKFKSFYYRDDDDFSVDDFK